MLDDIVTLDDVLNHVNEDRKSSSFFRDLTNDQISDPDQLTNEELYEIVKLCEHIDLTLADVCYPCRAALELEARVLHDVVNEPRVDPVLGLAEWERTPSPPADPVKEFLDAMDIARALAVNLFATGVVQGPVTPEELGTLVVGCQKYLELRTNLQIAGLHTLTEIERDAMKTLAMLVKRLSNA